MAIYLVEDNERNVYEIGTSKFFYRRMPSNVQKGMETRHTKRGQVNMRAVLEEVLEYCVLDWEGIKAPGSDQDIPFTKELVHKLPEAVKTELITLVYEGTPEKMLSGN